MVGTISILISILLIIPVPASNYDHVYEAIPIVPFQIVIYLVGRLLQRDNTRIADVILIFVEAVGFGVIALISVMVANMMI